VQNGRAQQLIASAEVAKESHFIDFGFPRDFAGGGALKTVTRKDLFGGFEETLTGEISGGASGGTSNIRARIVDASTYLHGTVCASVSF
jgi:hypothetical protein